MEPDTTTHDFDWDIQYFGDGQSSFNQVYALNDTLAYAVGLVCKNDSTGPLKDRYNAAKWNGKKWELKKIFLHYPTDSIVGVSNYLEIVHGDTPSGFLFSDRGRLIYFDLKSYVHEFWFYKQLIAFNAVWGPQSDRYFVGQGGTVVRGHGRTYVPETSPTALDLTDVWGNDNEVWAVGGWTGSSETVRLRRSNGSWERMDSIVAPYQDATYSVWCDAKGSTGGGFVGLAGTGIAYFDSSWKTLPWNITEGKFPGVGNYEAIRGSARNNVFAGGDFGVVVHYNGRGWKCITELLEYPSMRIVYSIAVTKNRVFLAGFDNYRGLLITGTRK